MTIGTSDGEQYTDSFEHYIDSLPSNLKPMLAGPSGKGTTEDGSYAPGEDARTPQMKSFGELTNYLSRIADPDKFRDAVSRMPESTNIDDRRNEDPIGNLIRKMKPLTDEDREQIKKDRALGKGGQLPVVDSDKLKGGKPLMEVPSGAGGSYPRIVSPDISKRAANINEKLPEIMIDGKMVPNKDPNFLGDAFDVNAMWNSFLKAQKKSDFLDKFKVVPKDKENP